MREIVDPVRNIRITMQLSVCGLSKCMNALVLMWSEGSIGNNAKVVKGPFPTHLLLSFNADLTARYNP
jgi:hypothetical protein